MEPLSRMAFSDLTTDENLNLAIPFSEDMTRQHDTDILCIPYSVTPFSIPSALQTLLEQKAILSDDIKFNPSTVQSKVVCVHARLLFAPPFTVHEDGSVPGARPCLHHAIRDPLL